MEPRKRPTGVTILGGLAVILGIASLLGGFVLVALAWALPLLGAELADIPAFLLGGGLSALGVLLLVLGILYFGLAYGFLTGRGWAWTLGIALSILSIVLNVLSAFVPGNAVGAGVGIIIAVLILYYLTRPHVKSYFGKGGPAPAMPPAGGPASSS